LWWIRWHWGRDYPYTLVFPANFHSTNFSTLIIIIIIIIVVVVVVVVVVVTIPGWYNRSA
jgi:hypothetical protein